MPPKHVQQTWDIELCAGRYDVEDVRAALDLDPGLPIVHCDARSKESAKEVLIALVEHVLATAPEESVTGQSVSGIA